MTVISNSVTAGAIFASGAVSNWIGDTMVAIQNSQNSAGILGALGNSGDGSVGSFLDINAQIADNFALISQNNVSSASAFYAQLASQNLEKRNKEILQKVLEDLTASQKRVKPQNVLDPIIYLSDGSTIDTENNILTRSDGSQFDTVTGAPYVDPAFIIQLANGAYIDTKNNIMTLADGTRIDTVTGLKI